MNPQTGAFRHINIGVKEPNKHFTMTSLLPEVTEAPDPPVRQSASPPVRQSASPPEDIDSERVPRGEANTAIQVKRHCERSFTFGETNKHITQALTQDQNDEPGFRLCAGQFS